MPLLTILVLIPALGTVAVAVLGRAWPRLTSVLALGFSVATLGVSGWLLWSVVSSVAAPHEVHAWIPALGASVSLGGDELTLAAVVWVALASVLTVASTRPGSRLAALVLLLEASAVALFLARDVFLVLASLGSGAIAVALLSSEPRKVLTVHSAGFAVLFGWFALLYRMVYEQTGFVSNELARWEGLVLYPGEVRSLFVLGGLGIAWLTLASTLALETSSRAGRLMLSATSIPVASYFVLGVLMPLSGSGAESDAGWVVVLAVLVMASTLFARGWGWVGLGYQGLVVYGLFTFREDAASGAVLMMIAAAVGLFAIELIDTNWPIELSWRKNIVWVFVLGLMGLPIVYVLLPVWQGDRFVAAIGTAGFAFVVHRVLVLGKRATATVERTG